MFFDIYSVHFLNDSRCWQVRTVSGQSDHINNVPQLPEQIPEQLLPALDGPCACRINDHCHRWRIRCGVFHQSSNDRGHHTPFPERWRRSVDSVDWEETRWWRIWNIPLSLRGTVHLRSLYHLQQTRRDGIFTSTSCKHRLVIWSNVYIYEQRNRF